MAPKTKTDDLNDEMFNDDDESILDLDEDFSDAEAPKLLPVGSYTAEIEKVAIKDSQSGTKYIAVELRVGTDQYPPTFSNDEEPNGIKLFYNYLQVKNEEGTFTAKARHRLRLWCEAIDAPMGKRLDVSSWVGRPIKVRVVHSKGNDGQPTVNMQSFAAID